ncbi:MAG: condensation domain-containing protein [Planctomycetota bacterium]
MTRPSNDKLKLLQKLLRDKGIEKPTGPSIPRRDPSRDPPLSFGQQRMWFLQQLEPESSEYNDTLTVRIDGAVLDPALVQRCIAAIVDRHEILRTAFVPREGSAVQRVLPNLDVPLRLVDLTAMAEPQQAAERQRLWLEDVRGAFVLDRPPLIRTTLLQLATDRWEFGLTMHHIASDGVAYTIFFEELGALYEAFAEGQPVPLTPLPVQFADYAAWERQTVSEEVIQRKLAFWRRYLAAPLPEVQLPGTRPRTGPRSHDGAFRRFEWSPALFQQLQDFCQREGVTSHWVLLGAYFALWHRFSGQEDLLIGTPSSVRSKTELEHMIGFFVQTLIVRLDISGNPTFREILRRAQKAQMDASLHEDVPFDRIVQAIRPGRAAADAPLIQAWIAPMKKLLEPIRVAGATSSYQIVDPKNARFDIALILDETEHGCTGYWEYSVDLFDEAAVQRIDQQWIALLQQVLRHPDSTLSTIRSTVQRADPAAPAPAAGKRLDLKKIKRRRG